MGVLDGTEIVLNGELYKLLREELASRLSRRRWQVERKRTAARRTPRVDVRPGEVDGDYTIAWSDWSKGVCGDHENLPGCIYWSEGVHGTITGSLRPEWTQTYAADVVSTLDHEADPCLLLSVGSFVFAVMGRYVYFVFGSNASAVTLILDHDFGVGIAAVDASIHNGKLVVALGASAKLQTRDMSGVWTTTTDNVWADQLTNVQGRLWRAYQGGVSNIGPSDDPLALASWSAPIDVTAASLDRIMDLNARGEQLVVSTNRGVKLGDRAAIFPDVLPLGGYIGDPNNGDRTVVRGADVFYPHSHGLIRYDGSTQEEVGIPFNAGEAREQIPGTRIRALAVAGEYLWAVTQARGYPFSNPKAVKFTQNNGSTYADGTAVLTDNNLDSYFQLGGMDTLANGDWLLVGADTPFYGIGVSWRDPNTSPSKLTGAYWNGTAWVQFPPVCGFHDNTSVPGFALYVPGLITWTDRGSDLSTWTPTTIGGVSAYWVRLTTTPGALDAQVAMTEMRITTANHRAQVWRGRPARSGDVRDQSIVWEPYTILDHAAVATAIVKTGNNDSPHSDGGALLVATRQRVYAVRLPRDGTMPTPVTYPGGGRVVSAKHDGGSPEVLKEWLYARVKGRTLAAGRTVSLDYRLDEGLAWTSIAAGIAVPQTTVPLAAGVVGYAIQWRLTFNAFTSEQLTEVNEIEFVYRERDVWRNYGTYLLEVYDGASASDGAGMLPDSDVQLTRLEALQGNASVPLRDATRRTKTVHVLSVKQQEVFQEALDYPVLAVEVQAAEV